MKTEADGPRSDEVPAAVLRRGRRVASVVFLTVVVLWVGYVSGQIVVQSLHPAPVTPGWETCDQALGELTAAVDRARGAAEGHDDVDTALTHFREALRPAWDGLEAAQKRCVSQEDRRSLDAIERLRYAEEHAVRREAASLSALRRQVASDLARRSRPQP